MALPKRPQKGQKVLQSLYDSVNSIIDYLPTITIRGDNYSTYIEHSNVGTIIHAKQKYSPDQNGGKGKEYFAGSGLYLSGNTFYNALSGDGVTIEIVDNVISCILVPSGATSGDYTSGRFINIPSTVNAYGQHPVNCTLSGAGTIAANLHQVEGGMLDVQPNYYIKIDEVANQSGYNMISCDLTHLTQLYNSDFAVDAQSPPSQGSGYWDHFMTYGDFFTNTDEYYDSGHSGLGTKIRFYRHNTNTGYDEHGRWIYPIFGIKVDCTLTGGRFIAASAVPRYAHPNTQTDPLDPEDLQLNCLLSGASGIVIGQPDDIYEQYPNVVRLREDFYQDLDDMSKKGPDYDVEKILTYMPATENSRSYLDWKSLPSGFFDIFTNVPTDGNYVLGCLSGTLTWLSTCQCDCCQTVYNPTPTPTPTPQPQEEPSEEEQNNG